MPPLKDWLHFTGFLEPALQRRSTPEGLALWVMKLPPDRLPARIGAQIIPGVELNPVPIRISKIEKEGVGNAVSSGAAFHGLKVAG